MIKRKASGPSGSVPALRFPAFRNAGPWVVKPFSDLFKIGNGKDYKHLATGDVPVYGSGGYMLSVDSYLHDGESVCIGRKGTINRPFLLTGKFWTVDTLFFTYGFKGCLPRFVYLYFQTIDWLGHNEAGGVPSLSKSNIEKIRVAIPSIDEQQRIADCFMSIDNLIDGEMRRLESLKSHKKGLAQHLLPRDGEDVPRLRFPKYRGTPSSYKTVGSIAKVRTGAKDTQDRVEDGPYPFFVRSQKVERIDTYSFEGEAILTSGDGVGVGENYHYINGKFDFHQRVYCITDFVNSVSARYFYYYFSERFKKRVKEMSAKNSVDSVRMAMITDMQIWTPSIQEQKRIAECLSSLDDTILSQEKRIDQLRSHKLALLQQLLPPPIETLG